jgi:fido (protein-threonine AMPylation protein)
LANPPSDGALRTTDLKPQFGNARPSSPRFLEARLQDLLDWLASESGTSMFPAERMALWFPRFLEISPFDRGNFRTAHLFLSYFSRSAGFPPVTLQLSEAEETRSDVENALKFDTYPLVRRFSDALARSLLVLETLRGSTTA